jgi:hypothetical protein
MKLCSFMVACKEYFGFREGQNLSGFMAEIKELTDDDRAYFTALFPSVGYQITK